MDALATAKKRLSDKLGDPKVKILGLGDDLKTIIAVVDQLGEVKRRTEVLAAVILRKHYGGKNITEAQWKELAGMGAEPARIHEAASHEPNCNCESCMREALQTLRAMSESGL